MKDTKVNLKLFKALFVDKKPVLFKRIKKMNSFSKAMSKTRYDSLRIEKNDRSILENIYVNELKSTLLKYKEKYPNLKITSEREKQLASELKSWVRGFFEGAMRQELFNMHRIRTEIVTKNDEQGWNVVNAFELPYLDLENPGNNKLFWNEKEVDGKLISEFIKITELTTRKSGRVVQIRLLDFNFGVSANESIPVKDLFHFINKNHRGQPEADYREIYDFKRPELYTYIDGLLKAAASKDYRVGDWKKWAEARRGFPLSYIPSFWDYLDVETQRNKQ